MANIVAIDDDLEILALIRTALERDGHRVDACSSTREVDDSRLRFADLVLLDVMMPDENGFSFCGRIRKEIDCPILFVTARSEESNLITGLGLGADDYIEKPFTVAELRARVNAHLRRENRGHVNAVRVGSFQLDMAGKQVVCADVPVPLTKSEYVLCEHLMRNVGQVFSKEQLAEAVARSDGAPDGGAVAEHVKNIRSKLKPFGESPIETVWGIGYRWRNERR